MASSEVRNNTNATPRLLLVILFFITVTLKIKRVILQICIRLYFKLFDVYVM